MRWRKRYEKLDPIAAGSKTFRAKDTATGHPLLVHSLAEKGVACSDQALQQVLALPADATAHLWDIWENDGVFYVVTDIEFGEMELGPWLQQACALPQTETSGEFTRVLQTVQNPQNSTPAPAAGTGGEFTRFFQADRAPSASAVASNGAAAGEFTRFFNAENEEQPKAALEREGGELTAIFRRPAQRPVRAPLPFPMPPPAPAAPIASAPGPLREAGDFTRFLNLSPTPAAPPEPSVPAVPAKPDSGVAAPGEYTRLISAQPQPVSNPVEAAAAAPKSAPRSRKLIPLAVFSVLGILALLLIAASAIWH